MQNKFVVYPAVSVDLFLLVDFGIVPLREDVPFSLLHASGSHLVHGPGLDFS